MHTIRVAEQTSQTKKKVQAQHSKLTTQPAHSGRRGDRNDKRPGVIKVPFTEIRATEQNIGLGQFSEMFCVVRSCFATEGFPIFQIIFSPVKCFNWFSENLLDWVLEMKIGNFEN